MIHYSNAFQWLFLLELEKERRVFYVAITRTKKNLYLFTHKYDDKGDLNDISLFLTEIDPTFYEVMDLWLN